MSEAQHPIDDGYRLSPETVERGVGQVMDRLSERNRAQAFPWRMVAAVALLIGAGFSALRWLEPEPCVTWACQFDDLSDDELEGMMELLEDGGETATWSDGDWNENF